MKKGFTLVELLAIIVILSFVFALVFPKVLEMTEEKETDIENAKLDMIYNAAEQYIRSDVDSFPKKIGNTYCIKIQKLDNENLIKITTKDYLNKYVKIKIGKTNSYSIIEETKDCKVIVD